MPHSTQLTSTLLGGAVLQVVGAVLPEQVILLPLAQSYCKDHEPDGEQPTSSAATSSYEKLYLGNDACPASISHHSCSGRARAREWWFIVGNTRSRHTFNKMV